MCWLCEYVTDIGQRFTRRLQLGKDEINRTRIYTD